MIGTWQNSLTGRRNSFPTNVTRFSRALSKFGVVKIDKVEYRVPQILFYQPGVGTGGFWDRVTGGTYGDTCSMPATWVLVCYVPVCGCKPNEQPSLSLYSAAVLFGLQSFGVVWIAIALFCLVTLLSLRSSLR